MGQQVVETNGGLGGGARGGSTSGEGEREGGSSHREEGRGRLRRGSRPAARGAAWPRPWRRKRARPPPRRPRGLYAAALCPDGGGAAACCFCRNRDSAGGTLPAPSRLGSKHGASAHTQSAKDISPAAGSPSPSPRRDAHVACDRSQPVCRARHSAASGSFSIRCRSAASDLGRAAGETRRK